MMENLQSFNRLINFCDADESIPRSLTIIQDAAKCMEGNLQFPVSSHGKFIDEYCVCGLSFLIQRGN